MNAKVEFLKHIADRKVLCAEIITLSVLLLRSRG